MKGNWIIQDEPFYRERGAKTDYMTNDQGLAFFGIYTNKMNFSKSDWVLT